MVGEDQSHKNLVYYQILFITVDRPLWPEECEADISYESIQEVNSMDKNEKWRIIKVSGNSKEGEKDQEVKRKISNSILEIWYRQIQEQKA